MRAVPSRLALGLPALALLALPAPVAAQSGGPDAFGYQYFVTPYDFVPLLGQTGAVATTLAGTGETTITLPFAFPYYGNSYTQLRIGAEGALALSTTATIPPSNGCLPALAAGSPDIAVFWDDLNPQSGEIRWWNDTANARLIVSWEDVAHAPNNGSASFQVQLYATGDIELHYADVDFGNNVSNFGISATVGIQDATGGSILGGNFLQWFCNSTQLSAGLGVKFSSCPDADGDGVTDATCGGEDCDDASTANYPGAPEACDGVDNDCDGAATDEDLDEDGDGQTPCAGDCDDREATVLLGGTETCDGLDNDCVSGIDDPYDGDGDQWATCVGDCDDAVPTIYPGAVEVCDGADSDCDGLTFASYTSPDGTLFTTANNGFRGGIFLPASPTFLASAAAWIDPMATFSNPREVVWLVYAGPDPNDPMLQVAAAPQEIPSSGPGWYASPPLDVAMQPGTYYAVGLWWSGSAGYGYETSPGFPQETGWGQQTHGASTGPWTEPADSTANLPTSTSYDIRVITGGEGDSDGDGELTCDDCDDTDGTVNTSATEICDGRDDDCDGILPPDELDADGDGVRLCEGDCDDADPEAYPGAEEVCNGLDDDCDSVVPADEADGDGDGAVACDDCDDTDDTRTPGAVELCDGKDNDCEDGIPADESDADDDGFRPCDGDCNDFASTVRPDLAVEANCRDGLDNDCDGDLDDADVDCLGAGDDDDDDDGAGDDDDDSAGGGPGTCASNQSAFVGAPASLLPFALFVCRRRRRAAP